MAKKTTRTKLIPNVTYHEPPVTHQEAAVETRTPPGLFYPKGKALPGTYIKRRVPCPNCRRLLLDDRGQAVVTQSIQGDLAYLRCRACGHRWKLPVEEK